MILEFMIGEKLKMKNLFIVHTPYHLMLAVGVCKTHINQISDILIYKDFNIYSIDLEEINFIFNNVYIYDKHNYPKINIPKIRDLIISRYKINHINNLIKNRYNQIFVFNESLIETQYIINKKIINKQSKITYIEDGANAYIKTYRGKNSNTFREKIRYFLYYGFKYENVGHTFGIHSKISNRKVLWPKIIRDDIRVDNINLEEIDSETLKLGINTCYKKLINKIVVSEERKILILLEHLDFFSIYNEAKLDEYLKIIEEIVYELEDSIIYIKYQIRSIQRRKNILIHI